MKVKFDGQSIKLNHIPRCFGNYVPCKDCEHCVHVKQCYKVTRESECNG